MTDADDRHAATLQRLEEELVQVREQRQNLAAQLGGEDAEDPDRGDRGDEAVQLEGLADLGRMDARIEELERLIADPGSWDDPSNLPDGTMVTLRFPDGDEATLRVVAIAVEASGDDVLTAGSPLGQALVDRKAGDTVTYAGPDGELSAEILSIS